MYFKFLVLLSLASVAYGCPSDYPIECEDFTLTWCCRESYPVCGDFEGCRTYNKCCYRRSTSSRLLPEYPARKCTGSPEQGVNMVRKVR